MQLHYRGASYTAQPQVIDLMKTGISATFRGISYPLYRPTSSRIVPSPNLLMYRGIAYGTANPESLSQSSLQQISVAI